MIVVLETFVALLSLLPLALSVNAFYSCRLNFALMYYPVFFVFFPLQIFFDLLVGKPEYPAKFNLLDISYDHNMVNVIYYLFLLSFVFLLLFLQLKRRFDFGAWSIGASGRNYPLLRFILLIFIMLGPISVFFTSNASIYLRYGEVRDYLGTSSYDEHARVWAISFLSAICVLVYRVLEGPKKKLGSSLLLLFVLGLDIYINGKRLIFVFPLLFFVIDYLYAGYSRSVKLLFILISLVFFVSTYATYDKFDREMSPSEDYHYFRLEFGRDDVMKYVIHDRLVEDERFLEYPGQSLVYTLLGYFPREAYEALAGSEKPYPYAQYLTGKLIRGEQGVGLLGWTMTTSIYDEMVANFSWLGFLANFALVIYFYLITDSERSYYLKFFYVSIMVLLTIVHTAPYLFLVYILLVIRSLRFFMRLANGLLRTNTCTDG